MATSTISTQRILISIRRRQHEAVEAVLEVVGLMGQIARSSRGFQNGRNSSIFGQRFMTTFRPAASASARRLVVVHADLRPQHLGADLDGLLARCSSSASELRNTSTMSTGRSISASER